MNAKKWKVAIMPSGQRTLRRLPEKNATAIVEFITRTLITDPTRVGKPLNKELAGQYAARRGAYRVVYRLDESTGYVIATRIDHRADVYRRR